MLNLTTKKSLPNTISFRGKDFSIYTDFRVWMRFMIDVNKNTMSRTAFDVSYLFKNEMPIGITIESLLSFASPTSPIPRRIKNDDERVISLDYTLDSDLIYAAFLQQYGIDLMEIEYLHWHKFIALLKGLRGTKLDEVMGYRNYKKETRKNYDPYQALRDAWEIIPEASEEEKQQMQDFSKQFGGG